MNYDILAERVRYFKENEEGIRTMCKAMEVLGIPEDDIPKLMLLMNAK